MRVIAQPICGILSLWLPQATLPFPNPCPLFLLTYVIVDIQSAAFPAMLLARRSTCVTASSSYEFWIFETFGCGPQLVRFCFSIVLRTPKSWSYGPAPVESGLLCCNLGAQGKKECTGWERGTGRGGIEKEGKEGEGWEGEGRGQRERAANVTFHKNFGEVVKCTAEHMRQLIRDAFAH